MFECRYCGNVFEKTTTIGACPACGGPRPNKLQSEVQTVIVNYVYVPATPQMQEYYTPKHQSIKQKTYSTFGYKLVAGLFSLGTIVFIGGFVFLWFFYSHGAPKDSDPAYQNFIPTVAATVTPYHANNPWEETVWLNSEDALNLRTKEQVINLVYLDRGGARYTNQSVVFDSTVWQQTKPLGVDNLTLSGTGYEFSVSNFKYNLNIYQPFVLNNQKDVLYLVDENGQFWKSDLANVTLVDLESAKSSLPISISPNPRLSPTY